MKPELIPLLVCPNCSGELEDNTTRLVCTSCSRSYALQSGIPIFSQPPENLQPSGKIERGPQIGTPWRQANWRFLREQTQRLDAQALLLDVGAGRGDFADLFVGRRTIALDIYPYPEVDLVCDLTQVVPLKAESFDAVFLMNVLEHVFDTHALLAALERLLKPGGVLIVAIPFLVKIHQAPVDFVRYTHYALARLADEHGLQLEKLEGFYDPLSVLGEGLGNLRHSVVPGLQGGKHYLARLELAGLEWLSGLMGATLGKGQVFQPEKARSQAPTGYHIVYRKMQGASTSA
jgi:SAM-dependent methyltransferase